MTAKPGEVPSSEGGFSHSARTDPLHDDHGRLDVVLRAAGMGRWRLDVRSNSWTLDEEACRLSGLQAPAFTGAPEQLFAAVHSDDRAALQAALARTIESDAVHEVDYRVLLPDGAERHVACRGKLFRDATGRPLWVDGIVWDITTIKLAYAADITERRKAQRALCDREAMLSSINANLEGACVYRMIYHADGRMECAYVSPNVHRLLGPAARRVVEDVPAIFELVHPDDRLLLREALANALRTGAPASVIARFPSEDRGVRWVHVRSTLTERRPDGAQVRDGILIDITHVKAAEGELREVRQRLELALRASRTCTWDYDLRAGRLTLDPAWREMLGYPAQGIVTRSRQLLAAVHPDDRNAVVAQARRVIRGETADYAVEHRVATAAGAWIWIASHGRATERDARGRVIRIIGTNTDITARRRAEEEVRGLNAGLEKLVLQRTAELEASHVALAQSEQRFRVLFEHSPIIIWLLSVPDGRIVECNSAALAGFGYARGEMIGHTTRELGIWADLQDRQAYVGAMRRRGHVVRYETRMRRKNGELFSVLYSGSLVEIGGQTYSLNSVHDITELREIEERYRHVFENAPLGIYRTTPEGRIVLANPALLRMLGCGSIEDLANRDLRASEWFLDQSRSPFMTAIARDGEVRGLESTWRRNDGSPVHVRENARVVRSADGRVLYYEGTAEDITTRRATEAALRESEARFRGVFDASPVPILLTDLPDGRILEANAASLTLFGYAREEVIGRSTADLGIWADAEQRAEFFRLIQTERSAENFEAIMRTRDGTERHMLCNGTPLELGGRGCLVASAVDITVAKLAEAERGQVRDQVFQAQKFEALGNLAGGIAHDFNNILTGVLNYTSLAMEELPPTHPQIREFLAEVMRCGERARELVRQILLFSRAEDGQQQPILLQTIVKEVLALLRATVPATIAFDVRIDPRTPVVRANPTQIHQVVMNLVINAAQAINGDPGRIQVRLEPQALDEAAARALPEITPGPHVRLEVTDTGCGMMPAVLERIFEPFFTTKPVGQGTGLGLAVVHSVVRTHRGAVKVRSQPGVGTTFELFFPVESKTAAPAPAAVSALPRGRGQMVLLIDDDAMVLRSTEVILRRLGYSVTSFRRAEEALAQFCTAPQLFEVVITDYQMPAMTGLMVARKIRERSASVPILLASGFLGNHDGDSLQVSGVTAMLNKPIALAELANALMRVVGPERPRTDAPEN